MPKKKTAKQKSLKTLVGELNNMILKGKFTEAFEMFYADDVVMQENNAKPRVGKELNRKFQQRFVGSIQQFNKAELRASVVDEAKGIAMNEWFMDVTFKNGVNKKMTEVAVQHWKNGKVVKERFYYNSR